jgi:dihydrofolate reductase
LGRLVVNNAMTVNGAFEAPVPEPDGWLVLDADSNNVSLEQFLVADAMLLGRKTYEGLAAVWPQLTGDPSYETGSDGGWHDGLLLDLLPEDLTEPTGDDDAV